MVTRTTRLVREQGSAQAGGDTEPAPDARDRLDQVFAQIREREGVPEAFDGPVTAEAIRVASTADGIADAEAGRIADERGIEFVTIDPAGAMDLDQALHIEPVDGGWRVRYAIADLAAYVEPGAALDAEARRRGQTVYCPDLRIPLHPMEVSEGVASLLPDQDCRAYLWEIVVEADGRRRSQRVYRALVRSRRRYTYTQVQDLIDAGEAEPTLTLLRDVGRARLAREAARGGASLPMPEQVVTQDASGRYGLEFRPRVPAEEWNAQISLLTGIAAAGIMLDAGVGILRTMPPPSEKDQARFRRQAAALGVSWPDGAGYGDVLRDLDGSNPRHLALIHDATALFRGASYTAFDGAVPEQPQQAALAAAYTHTTAPLRRLVDRFVLVVCEALCQDRPVPEWARQALPELPGLMQTSDRRTRAVERACTEAVEAAVLSDRIGQEFDAVVVDEAGDGWQVQVTEPAVDARAEGKARLGDRVRVRLVTADPATHTVRFEILPPTQ